MSRLTLIVAVAVTVGMAGLGYSYFEDAGPRTASMYQLELTKRRLDADYQRMEQFRKLLDQTLGELADEDVTLAQAVDRIEEASTSYYPIYVQKISFPKRAASARERIAHNIVRHFIAVMEDSHGDTTQLNKVLCKLRLELASMFPAAPTATTGSED